MSIEHFYDVAVKWKAGRTGVLSSTELDNTIEVATPPQFPNGVPGIWSPEHLLVAAVNSCFMTTFLSVADNSKLRYHSFECAAKGKLETVEGKYMISEITLNPVVELENEEDRERAIRILQKTEANCLISNSVKSKIIFEPEVKVAALAHHS
jgi:peroxiredoxin-like protein